MIRVIDIDALFDKYIEKYVYDNIGKIKPEEIEDNIPVMFEKFGREKHPELDGKTPSEYYQGYSAEQLLKCLKSHLEKDVPVSDYLCGAITDKGENAAALINAMQGEENEEYLAYLMNMLSDMGGEIPVSQYIEYAVLDYPESIGELATESLAAACESNPLIAKAALAAYETASDKKRERIAEILSHARGNDGAFEVLKAEFAAHQDNLPLYAAYLAKFGDERALPVLYGAIERENITYADFEELRFAIESLGGTYDKERDFSADKTYKKIKGVGQKIKK